MGFKTLRTSDLSGRLLEDEDVVNVVIRAAPGIDAPKQFDCSWDEIATLVTIADLVSLEVRLPDGTTQELSCTAEEFGKVVPDRVVAEAAGLRGRRPGQRPGTRH